MSFINKAGRFLTGVVYRAGLAILRHHATRRPGGIGGSDFESGSRGGRHGHPDVTTGAQIADALNVAIAAGAPLQIGAIDPALTVRERGGRATSLCAEGDSPDVALETGLRDVAGLS